MRRVAGAAIVVILLVAAGVFYLRWNSAHAEQAYIDAHGVVVAATETGYTHSHAVSSGSYPFVTLRYTTSDGQTFTRRIEMTNDALSSQDHPALQVRYDPRHPDQMRLVSQPGISETTNGSWDRTIAIWLVAVAALTVVFEAVWTARARRTMG